MGKSLSALLGVVVGSNRSSSKTISKLKTLFSLSVARLSLLKNYHQSRCGHARSDVAHLLLLGHTDRALLRAEIVAKEENMLDVFAIIQSYCHLIAERSLLLQGQKDCPHELKESISSLIYASSRSGEMPELQHVCSLFSSMFGREFILAATELRNCCGVNPKIVQKLSTKESSLESRVRIIKEIAAEKGVTLDLTDKEPIAISENSKVDTSSASNKNSSHSVFDSAPDSDSLFGSNAHNYKAVVSAAQAAFEKAEDAAVAARAVVELSRSSQSFDDNNNRGNNSEKNNQEGSNNSACKLKVHPVQYYTSESDEDEEETVLSSDKYREISDSDQLMQGPEKFPPGIISDSTDSPFPEKQLHRYGSWASKKNEREIDNKFDTDLNFINQKKYPEKKSFKISLQPDIDTRGLVDSTGEDSNPNTYDHTETMLPKTGTVSDDYTKKSPVHNLAKVTRRAVSVRTRR